MPATAAAKVEGGLLGQAEGLADAWTVAMRQAIAFLGEWGAVLVRDHPALPVLVVGASSWVARAGSAG